MRPWKIVAAGEGGQGIQALAETLALAAYRAGLQSLYIPNFGIEQRGGVSLAFVQISPAPIGSPKFLRADLVAALSPRALRRSGQYLGPETFLLYDNSLIDAPQISDEVVGLQSYDTIAPEAFAERSSYRDRRPAVEAPSRCLVAVAASDLARQRLHPRVFNMIILGAIVEITGAVTLEQVKEALEEKLDRRFKKDPRLREHNFAALELGAAAVKEKATAQA
ncbi:MAG: pyruvate oxidoreductase subunit gamma [Firmicutes bacterium]|jgi:2-oxoglutarate ferredoxin oxidoreductase subunit gamma|nr:pyruvate oxidoreductase subunit gamma [Bacillota bacterium]HPU01599.1 2-oxoacid:acceptor oxidoreductase family protein [Bacillota bacterium]